MNGWNQADTSARLRKAGHDHEIAFVATMATFFACPHGGNSIKARSSLVTGNGIQAG